MLTLLVNDVHGKRIITIVVANKLNVCPYIKDIKFNDACTFHNRLRNNEKSCVKEEMTFSKKHVCACCGKTTYDMSRYITKMDKADVTNDKLFLRYEIFSMTKSTAHNNTLQIRSEQ